MKNIEKSNRSKRLTTVLLILYLIVLSWVILLKADFTLEGLQTVRTINLIPLGDSAIVNNRLYTREIYLNAIVFIPLGVYLSMLKPTWSFVKKALVVASISFLFETIQYIFAIGGSDITDIMSNTLGGLVGVLFYKLISIGFRNKVKMDKIINILALFGTLGVGIIIIIIGFSSVMA